LDRVLDIDVALDLPDFRFALREQVPLQGITAVMGPSGSGKTTFLRVLAGLEPGATGTLRFAGEVWQDATTHRPAHARRVGVVFQDARLFPHLDVAGNLAFGARRRGVASDQVARVAEALQIAPLMDRRIDRLSGGEARRVAVARALSAAPRLLLLDEPLSGLDADLRDTTLRVIAEAVRALAIPAIYVSHSRSEVSALADRTLAFAGGGSAGWQAAPVVLTAQAKARDGQVMLQLGDVEIPAPPGMDANAPVALAVAPDDLFVSERDPGRSSAKFSICATVDEVTPDQITLRAGGQMVTVPVSGMLRAAPPAPGDRRWLSVRRFWLRAGD